MSACQLKQEHQSSCVLDLSMDLLHAQIVAIQNRLSFVQDDPTIDWRSCVLKLSWGICLFEIFLLCVYSSS
jgi:hypothetical protein